MIDGSGGHGCWLATRVVGGQLEGGAFQLAVVGQ